MLYQMQMIICFSVFRLTELQMARDDLLFELHKQTQQSPTDKNVSLTKYVCVYVGMWLCECVCM